MSALSRVTPHHVAAALLALGVVGGSLADTHPPTEPERRGDYLVLRADFHAHTRFSDGFLSPLELPLVARREGLQALAVMARGADKRSWAVLGEMAELGEESITEHDRIGRLAVRLDISRLIVVGTGRPMNAMHHGAVMEGSWGSEATIVPDADAALALLRAEVAPGDVVLVKASNAAGLGALAEALAEDRG